MEKKELEQVLGKVSDEVKTVVAKEMEAAKEGLMTAEGFDEKLKSAGLEDGKIKELTEAIEAQGEEMRKFAEKQKANEVESIDQLIEEKSEEIKKIATGEAKSTKFTIGRKTLVQRSAVSGSTMSMVLPGVGQIPYLGTVMSGLFNHAGVSASSNGVIRYYDQNSVTRNAAPVAEAAQKPESAIDWIERTLNLEKIADSIPVTKESFQDVGFIESEVRRLLDINLALKEDQQLYSGTGVSPEIKGLITSAPAFNAGGYAGITVADATLYDLLAILRVEITNSKQSKYNPTAVLMNPADILRYKLAKATDGHYVLPPFISADGTVIDGMRVVESSQVVVNTMVLGDYRYGTIYDLEGVTVEMGYINDQFIKNAMTILAEKREGLLIRVVDEDAFLKVTDIDAAIAAVTAP